MIVDKITKVNRLKKKTQWLSFQIALKRLETQKKKTKRHPIIIEEIL